MDGPRIESVARHLQAYGLEVSMPPLKQMENAADDQRLVLERGGQSAQFVVQPDVETQPTLFGEGEFQPLIIQEYIGERQASEYRKSQLNYADEAGNAHINFAGIYIDVRGRRPPRRVQASSSPSRRIHSSRLNLFSARRSRLIFVLLTWPQLTGATIRELSHAAGVSVGLAQETIKQMGQDGYLTGGPSPRLVRQSLLFDLWSMTYPQQLAPTLSLQSFKSADIRQTAIDPGSEVGGESALPELIVPSSLTLYVNEFSPTMAVKNRWKRDNNPNVFIREKFWTDTALLDLERHNSSDSPPTVPSTLIYADLLASDDPRQREVAETFKNHDHRLLRISRS